MSLTLGIESDDGAGARVAQPIDVLPHPGRTAIGWHHPIHFDAEVGFRSGDVGGIARAGVAHGDVKRPRLPHEIKTRRPVDRSARIDEHAWRLPGQGVGEGFRREVAIVGGHLTRPWGSRRNGLFGHGIDHRRRVHPVHPHDERLGVGQIFRIERIRAVVRDADLRGVKARPLVESRGPLEDAFG